MWNSQIVYCVVLIFDCLIKYYLIDPSSFRTAANHNATNFVSSTTHSLTISVCLCVFFISSSSSPPFASNGIKFLFLLLSFHCHRSKLNHISTRVSWPIVHQLGANSKLNSNYCKFRFVTSSSSISCFFCKHINDTYRLFTRPLLFPLVLGCTSLLFFLLMIHTHTHTHTIPQKYIYKI